jgi:hypothetical protein
MSKGLVKEIFKRAIEKSPGERKKRTLVLSIKSYEKFELICRKKDLWPSEIVDEFIKFCVEEKKIINGIK